MKNKRSLARELLVRALYAWDISLGKPSVVADEIMDMTEMPISKDAKKYVHLIIKKFEEHLEEVDKEISSKLENWTIDDIGDIERAILRVAFTEFLYIKPKKNIQAIIDYIDIANMYGNKKTASFINGVLSHFANENNL